VFLAVGLLLGAPAPAGAQAATCFGRTPTITDNGPGDQDPREFFILGTPGPDVIAADRAEIDGGAGDDVLCGLAASDLVRGGAGNDTLLCVEQRSICDGGPGDDELVAAGILISLLGGDGDDRLRCMCDRSTLDGGPGNDTFDGLGGAASVSGGDGDDTITGGAGWNLDNTASVGGGAGNDTITLSVFSPPASDIGSGRTWLSIGGGAGHDVIRLTGSVTGILVDGGDGNDRVDAGESGGAVPSDYLVRGGAGVDELTAGPGPHRLEGGADNDRLVVSGTGNVLDGELGVDWCAPAAGNTLVACEPDATGPAIASKDLFGPDGRYAGTDLTLRDAHSGLARVEATVLVNARPAAPVTLPRIFSPPTTAGFALRIVPIDPAKPVSFTLRATDAAGNARTVDPVVVLVARERGKPVATTVELAPGERWAEVRNGTPGLGHLRLSVNGQRYEVSGLRDGETRTLDVGSALRAAGNTATLEARGKPGGRATVVLHD
jgi:Ca2+-binding RTX toxin-like protein